MTDPQTAMRGLVDQYDDAVHGLHVHRLLSGAGMTAATAGAMAAAAAAGSVLVPEAIAAHPFWTGVVTVVVAALCRLAGASVAVLLARWDDGHDDVLEMRYAIRHQVLAQWPERPEDGVQHQLDDLDDARRGRRAAVSVVSVLAVVVAACFAVAAWALLASGVPRPLLTGGLALGAVAGDVLLSLLRGGVLGRTRANLLTAQRRHRETALHDRRPPAAVAAPFAFAPAAGSPLPHLAMTAALGVVLLGPLVAPYWSADPAAATSVTSAAAALAVPAARASAVPVSWPAGVVVSSDGRTAYVASSGPPDAPDDLVVAVDLATETVRATVRVAPGPRALALSPDGARLYVTAVGSDSAPAGAVSVIDTRTDRPVATLPLPAVPWDLVVGPDGLLWMTSDAPSPTDPGSATAVDARTMRIVATVPVGADPWRIAADIDRGRVYVGNHADDTVSVIDTATRDVVATVAVGHGPAGLAVDERRQTLWVCAGDEPDHRRGLVAVDTDTLATTAVDLGQPAPGVGGAQTVTLLPDGHALLVGRHANSSGPHPLLSIIDPDTRATTATLTLPRAFSVAPTPDSDHAVTTSGDLWLLDIP